MGVLIKDMDLPKCCAGCPFYHGNHYGTGDCTATYEDFEINVDHASYERNERCPLEEVDDEKNS